MTTSVLQSLQARYGAAVDREVSAWLEGRDHLEGFYGMMQYQLGYVDARFEPCRAAGKRFRPILCLLASEAVGGNWRDALPVAAGIELLHNFSLIHDDIEDRDPSRRHRPTVWKVWGEPQAINAGDGMFAVASRAVLAAMETPEVALAVAREFGHVSLELTEGQYLDMSFETRQEVTPDEYLEMIDLKTAALISFSIWSGAYIGGAGDETRQALRTFGDDLGKAFQVHDDIMGIWGRQEVTGKEVAKDLHNRKKTLPVLQAWECANPPQRTVLRDFFARDSDDVEAVLAVLGATRSRQQAEGRVREFLTSGLAALDEARIDQSSRRELEQLALELTAQ